jgi:hypothetical protein
VPGCVGILYFAEVQAAAGSAPRQFDIFVNGDRWGMGPFTAPLRLASDATYTSVPYIGVNGQYNFTLNATANSTLPPIINAAELFSVVSTVNVATDADDGDQMRLGTSRILSVCADNCSDLPCVLLKQLLP